MNNFKKVIALLLMTIMVLSIGPVGVLAEDAPSGGSMGGGVPVGGSAPSQDAPSEDTPIEDIPVDETPSIYWDKDIMEFNVNDMEKADTLKAAIEPQPLSFKDETQATGTLSFEGDVKIDDAPLDANSKGDGKAIHLPPRESTHDVPTKVTLDFDGTSYAEVVEFKFDLLFGETTEGLIVNFADDAGASTFIKFTKGSFFIEFKGTDNNKIQHGISDLSGNTERYKWQEVIVTLTTNKANKKQQMSVTINGREFKDNTRGNTTIYDGLKGNLKKIEFVRDSNLQKPDGSVANPDVYVWIDNLAVRSYKEKPEFVDASYDEEGNLKPTPDIDAKKVLDVELDTPVLTPALEGEEKEFIVDNEKSTFTLKKVDPVTFEAVDGGSVEISKAITVGDENHAWQLYLDNKLADGGTYMLTMANITDSSDREPIELKYLFTTKAKPENNQGVYKLGYLVDGDNNLTGDEIGAGASVTADLQVINYSEEEVEVTGAIAIYKKVGDKLQLCGIKAATETLEPGATSETLDTALNITTPSEDSEAVYVAKTFAWKDLENFTPFASDSYR